MARKRMIDPDFWTDEKLGDCARDERLLFMGLISNADDEGRGRANPKLVKSTVFPYDEDLNSESINSMLKNLDNKKIVQLYLVDEQEFYFIRNFKKHQVINKKQTSKLPTPPQDTPLHENYGSSTVVVEEHSVPREEKRREEKRKEVNRREEKGDSLSQSVIEIIKFYETLKPGQSIAAHQDAIRVLVEMYSFDWVKDALQEMIKQKDKFIQPYLEKILKNWQTEGKEEQHGNTGGNNTESQGKFSGFKPPPPKRDESIDTSDVI